MKLFVAAMINETDTFNPHGADIELYRQGYIVPPEETERRFSGTETEVGGFYEYFRDHPEVALVPGPCCWAVAAGRTKDAAFEKLAGDLIAALRANMPVDGVLVALHGALVTESNTDADGEILARIRAVAGPGVPVVATLDYHANLTRAMLENSDALIGFRTYPHIDFKSTGLRAARAAHELLLNPSARPRAVMRKLPMLVPVEDSETGRGVSGHVIGRLAELDGREPVFQASFFCTQPWLDIPGAGMALLFYARSAEDALRLEAECDALAGYILRNKDEYFKDYPGIGDVLAGIGAVEKPAILVDSGDVTTGGSSGESTVILRALLETRFAGAATLNIVCPEAVAAAVAAGEGAEAELLIGDERIGGFAAPVRLVGVVEKILGTQAVLSGQSFGGVAVDAGTRVYFRSGGIHLLLFAHTTFLFDPSLLLEMGIDPRTMDIIVQKSHKLFRAAYKDIAKTIIPVDTPGYTDHNLKRLPYVNVTRPLYPLDPID